MNYPILMADIIDSSKKNSKLLMTQFKKTVSTLNNNYRSIILSPLTITLGDEFQGVPKKVDDGINIIFALEELIIKNKIDLKLRYVLVFGTIDTKINRKASYEMLGPGLTETRRTLNSLKKEDSRFFLDVSDNAETNYFINKTFSLYQSIVDGWKPKDMRTVAEFLADQDYKNVAKKIKTDVSSAWRRKRSLKINEYFSAKELILYLAKD